jgi:hypothetical protein
MKKKKKKKLSHFFVFFAKKRKVFDEIQSKDFFGVLKFLRKRRVNELSLSLSLSS